MHRRWGGWIALLVPLMPAEAVGIKGTLTGTVVDWPARTGGTVQLLMDWPDDQSVIQVGTRLDTTGKFSVTLPDLRASGLSATLPKISGLFTATSNYNGCPGKGTATLNTGTFKSFWLVVSQDGLRLGDIEYRNNVDATQGVGTVLAELMYFSQTTTLNGTLTCPQDENVMFQGTFPAGWNLVQTEVMAGQAPGKRIRRFISATSQQGMAWRLYTEYGGTGMTFKSGDVETTVETVIAGQPAALAGLKVNDVILSVDGKSGLPFAETLAAIRGTPDTEVVLVVRRAGEPDDLTFHVMRALIRTP